MWKLSVGILKECAKVDSPSENRSESSADGLAQGPDLNAIENAWDLLQGRLLLTAHVDMESRGP